MAVMRCLACGGECEFKLGKGYVCNHCGKVYSGSEISDEVTDKLNYSNSKRIENYDFEAALRACLEILDKNPDNQEANFGALLAEYQIVYLENAQGEFKPTLLNPDVAKPINRCGYYQKLNTDFKHMADFAEEVRLEVVRESRQIPDYDVFISYKQHVDNSDTILTEEAEWAAEIYRRLKKAGLRVFYDEESLKKGTAGWEPHIYSALKSSKYLILLGSSIKNINSTWVKNEWKRFLSYRKKDGDKSFSVVKKNFKPEEADFDLQSQQMLDANQTDWMDVLVENVKNHFVKYEVKYRLDEADAFILNRKFKKARECYSKVCNADQRNSNAYWGLLKCKVKAMDDYDLVKSRKKIGKTEEYTRAVQYSEGEEKERYERVGRDNLTRRADGYERKNYIEWRKRTKVSRFFKQFAAISLSLIICAAAVLGVLWYRDLKSREYKFILDYGEAAQGKVSSVKAYEDEPLPVFPDNLIIDGKYYMDFAGWYTQPDCRGTKITGKDGKSDLKMAESLTSLFNDAHRLKLYAGFELHKYAVTFYDTDGTTVLKTVRAEYGTLLEDIGSEIYAGEKTVYSWSENVNGKDYTGEILNDMSFYATSYAVKVNYESGGGSAVAATTVRVGDKVPMPMPKREYYGFEGWTYKDNIVQDGFVAPQENITLVAKWSKTHFSLVLDSNGGLDDSSQMVKAGTIVSLPVITRKYNSFVGWEYNGNIVDNSFTMPEKDVILKAQWERTHYKVSLDGQIQYVRKGESITLPAINKQGYTFRGWEYNGEVYKGAFTPTGDVTLKPSLQANTYTVTLNTNGGTASSATSKVTYDSTYTLPVPTRSGYEFAGWYTGTDKYAEKRTDANGNSTAKWSTASDTTLYAVWFKEYSISLNRQGCEVDNGFNPQKNQSEQRIKTHNGFELLELVVDGCVAEDDGSYRIIDNNNFNVSLKLLQNLDSLPKNGVLGYTLGLQWDWQQNKISNDSYVGKVYGTNINNQKIGYGAYYLKATYYDYTTKEFNAVNILDGMKKGNTKQLSFDMSSNKKIRELEVVVVYEIYYYVYSGGWWGDNSNWRCSATLNFG